MADEYWAYEKAAFERYKHGLEVSPPETVSYQDALRDLLELAGSLFKHLNIAADIECEREELKDVLEKIAAPHACGCKPCTGQCLSQDAMRIDLDEIRDMARAAIAVKGGQSNAGV